MSPASVLTRMKPDGQFIGYFRLCEIELCSLAFKKPHRSGTFTSIGKDFAELFPELNDEDDPNRVVFIGNI